MRTPTYFRREIFLTRALLALTLVASGLLARELLGALHALLQEGARTDALESAAFLAIAVALLYGTVVYQVTRIGQLKRRFDHRPAPRRDTERIHDEARAPSVAILVPSYCEEPEVVRRTLISAALQDYPDRRVVLLIDDPPNPTDPDARTALAAARRLPREVSELLEKPAHRFTTALAEFSERAAAGGLDVREELARLAQLHAEAAAWFTAQVPNEPTEDPSERQFRALAWHRAAATHGDRCAWLEAAAREMGSIPAVEIQHEYRVLAARFDVAIESFERKRFENLSHEPNKAMNLNAYLGLFGGSFCEEQREDGIHLVPATAVGADRVVPDADFVITLDADSLIDPEYALRLVHWISQTGNERVAVVQTPYSAFPGAPGLLERVAGATTDIQYLIHQGFTRFGGTYWVGANALLRTEALRDIRSERRERGHPAPVFIQDRTVIEDTESTVDLVDRGWTLHNYPERLAWSATPPDFGSLLIQRRRWANGGLLILPKLARHLARGASSPRTWAEGFVRIHYLVSITAVNLALLALLLWPFETALRSYWFPAAALPYFFLYGRDLVQVGYRAGDLVRAYALNLLLLPINLGGVAKSLQQAATGCKTPFARTPKVPGRTPAPAFYHVAEWGLLAAVVGALLLDVTQGRWFHASFLAANGGLLAWALLRMVGPRATLEDLRLAAASRRDGRPSRAERSPVARLLDGGLAATAALSLGALGVALVNHAAWFTTPENLAWIYGAPLIALALSASLWWLPGTGRLALLSVLTTLLCVDTGFRFAAAAREPAVESWVAPEYYRDDALLGYAAEPGVATRAWKRVAGETVYDVEYVIDEHGRRVTPQVDAAGRDRFLLGFGGSFMFGEGVSSHETLPAQLALLAPHHRVYNYGFHGYGPPQLLAKLEDRSLASEIEEREGTLVYLFIDAHVLRSIGSLVVHTGWADATPYYELDEGGQPTRRGTLTTGRPATALIYSLAGQSGLVRWLRADLPPRITDEHIDLTARLLTRAQTLYREQLGDQRFVVVIYPDSRHGERLSARLAALGVETLDYRKLFDPAAAGFFLPEDWHPSGAAHRTLAARLAGDLGLGGVGMARRGPAPLSASPTDSDESS